MKHAAALLIKLVVIGTVLFSFLTIFHTASLGSILMLTILATGVSYVVGDLFILPRFGQIAAAIGDFILAFGMVWAYSLIFFETTTEITIATFFAALAITASEIFFHLYMQNRILNNGQTKLFKDVPASVSNNRRQFATEFSDEINPEVNEDMKQNR